MNKGITPRLATVLFQQSGERLQTQIDPFGVVEPVDAEEDVVGVAEFVAELLGSSLDTGRSGERLEVCRKHDVKMMIDSLAWKEGAEMDVRRPTQQARVLELCRKLRGDDAVWGYTLWHERLDRYSPGNIGSNENNCIST